MLFLLDVDNAVFAYCLPETVRSDAEATGRAIIGSTERSLLAYTKQIYTVAVTVAIPLSVFIASFPVEVHHIEPDWACSHPAYIVFFICGVMEARVSSPGKWHIVVPKIFVMFFLNEMMQGLLYAAGKLF